MRAEVLAAVNALDDFIHDARPIPFSDQVRVDPEALGGHAGRVRAAMLQDRDVPETSGAWEFLDRIDVLVREARSVPLLGGVSLDREELYDLTDQLRAAMPRGERAQAVGGPRATGALTLDLLVAVDALDDFLHNAPPLAFRDSVRVKPEKLAEHVGQLREAARRELPDPVRSRTWPLLDRVEALADAAEPVRWLLGVAVDREALYDVLDELRVRVPQDYVDQGGVPR